MSITRIGGPDTSEGSDKPKPREITSIEELTPVVQDALLTAVSKLTDPISREMEEPYVDIPKAFVDMNVDINIPGMSKGQAMEAVLTDILGGREVIQEADAADNVYVVQYTEGVPAIMLSKVLKTDEAIRLASGSIALSRKDWSSAPGSTLRAVGADDRPYTKDDVIPMLKRVFLGEDMRLEEELRRFTAAINKPPIMLLTCRFHSCQLNRIDRQSLEFLNHMGGIGWAFRIQEGSKHFLLQTDEIDSPFLSEVRRGQHAKIAEALS